MTLTLTAPAPAVATNSNTDKALARIIRALDRADSATRAAVLDAVVCYIVALGLDREEATL